MEGPLAKTTTYGVLAAVIGFGAWWWSRQRAASTNPSSPQRAEVIFHNTPEPTPLSGEGII
jgi:hypothetical protein